MTVLTIAVVLVGGVALLNLALTFAVIRRLRQHSERLAEVQPAGLLSHSALPIGETVADFTTADVDGEALNRADLTGQAVVGFFTPGCEPCQAMLPQFVARVRALPPAGWQAVAVVVSNDAAEATSYLDALRPYVRTVVEPVRGPVQKAFGAVAYPAVVILDEQHLVTGSGSDLGLLSTLPNAARQSEAAARA